MTDAEDQFQLRYHDYQTFDRAEALAECAKANEQLALSKANTPAVVVDFGDLGYALMLQSAAAFVGVLLVRED